MARPRATLDRVPIAPASRRGSRININLRPLRPSGGTATGINGVSRSRRFDVDGNVDIDIGVPTFMNRGQGAAGINIPDTRATIDMTSRVPATSARRETTRTANTITGSGSNVAGSRIDSIDNTIDGSGLAIDGSTSSVKTTTIKKIGREGIIDTGSPGTVTRTTTTTTRRLAEAGITGESALSIENQLQAIEQQLVAAAGVARPVFAVIPMNEKANQADFNEFLRNMTNANQVNIIDRKSSRTSSTRTLGGDMGVDNSLGTMAVDGVIGGGVGMGGPSTVSSSSRSSSSFQSSSTRTSSTGANSGDIALGGSGETGGTGSTKRVTKTTVIRRTSSDGNTVGTDLGLDGFGGNIDGSMSNSVGSDGLGGGSFTSSRIGTSGSMAAGSGLIDAGLQGTGTSGSFSSGMGTDLSGSFSNDMGLDASGSFSNDMGTGMSSSFSSDASSSFSNDVNIFPTNIPSVNDVTSMPDPIGL